jgi:hypothetical protein
MKINSPKVFSDRKKAELGFKKMLKELSDNIDKMVINELIKIPGEKETPNYSKMNLEDILNLSNEEIKEFNKEATKELKELLEEKKKEDLDYSEYHNNLRQP